MSPVVSPDGVEMGRFLMTEDDCNNYSRHSKAVICALLTTSANCCKKGIFAFRKPPCCLPICDGRDALNTLADRKELLASEDNRDSRL